MTTQQRIEKLEKKLAELKSQTAKWFIIGNLEWLVECSKEEMNWNEAQKWCEERGGRLPTRLELFDLCDNHPKECQKLIKNDNENWYWSATEFSATNAWAVSLSSGTTFANNKATASNYVRCVRGLK